MSEHHLVGLYVTASKGPRSRSGVVLPPRPGSRATSLRLADDEGTLTRFDPQAWTLTPHHSLGRDRGGKTLALTSRVCGRPTYRFGDLPARHLATKTMLRREHRAQPGPGQLPVAYYDAKEQWAPLYAVADAVALPPLPEKRAEAWTATRTCIGCSHVFERPLQKSPEGDRYCEPCHLDAVPGRWTEQMRPVQAQIADWARAVLADPGAVLAKSEYHWAKPLLLVETLDGEQLLHLRLRGFPDITAAADPDSFAGTVHASEILPQLREIAGRRIITWDGISLYNLTSYSGSTENLVPTLESSPGDRIAERYALWTGRAPGYRSGFWLPTPKLPWTHTHADDQLYRTAADAPSALQTLRHHLRTMATEPAPEPTIPEPGA